MTEQKSYYGVLGNCACFPEYPKATFIQCQMCKDIQNDPLTPKLLYKLLDEEGKWTRDNPPYADNKWYLETFKKSYWYQFYLKDIQVFLNKVNSKTN